MGELLSSLVDQAGDALHQLDMLECVLRTARRYLYASQEVSSCSPSVHILSLITSLSSQLRTLVPQVEGDISEGVEEEFFAMVQEALTGVGSYSPRVLLFQLQLLSEYRCRESSLSASRQAIRESFLLNFYPSLQHAARGNTLSVQNAAESILTWMAAHNVNNSSQTGLSENSSFITTI